ncbi:MAG TPA: Mur ligase family protein [Patescibacteria group bacterium]|nr:Mur ligase family protein [Patescibacteria group bacterium]
MKKFLGITDDSRKVRPGFVFVAIKGKSSNGHDYIDEAIKKGAAVVFGEEDIKNPKYVRVPDSRQKLGELASEFFGFPSRKLKIIGVTGTKGKTTTSHLIYHILSGAGKKVGLISSNMAKIGEREKSTGFHITSPDVISLHKFLKEMVDEGCQYAVLEVSSHGIDQKRIAGVEFEIAVLTNIAPEHLDYHKTFAEYKRVKMSFVNSAKTKVISPKSAKLDILPGEFNNINAETAIQVASKLGISEKDSLRSLTSFVLPQGRLEEIKNNEGFKIFIDFAHTPGSLEAVLTHLRTITKGNLIVVFGCAGERDRKKRRKMGKISGDLADLSIFTAEDPRSENITDIFRSMKQEAKNFICIPERGEAIAYALSIAKKGDVVAFLGKGHEASMAYSAWDSSSSTYKGYEHPWSDRTEISNFLLRKRDVSAIILAAGKGSRMKSAKPKILHEICGRPMISYSLQNLRRAKVGEIVAVVSYRKNLVNRQIGGEVKIAIQKNSKGGTADAAASGLSFVSKEAKNVMVLYGDDTAFYTAETIDKVLSKHLDSHSKLTFITLMKDDPHGLGRIIRDKNGNLMGIVEEKDADLESRKIKEVNDGLYIFDKRWLLENLPKVKKSAVTGELYIVELIKMAIDQREKIFAYTLPTDVEWQGINTQEELEKAKAKMEQKLLTFNI